MPMDGFTLSYMRRELLCALKGGRVDKVNQPERDALVLLIRCGGGNHRLLLSANANQARAQLTRQSYENPAEPPMFCMLMRKHLLGARVADVGQVAGDRILTVVFDCLDELGDPVQKTLYLEVMGRYSNLTLVRGDGVIIDAIRHVSSDMSRVRTVQPGGVYQLPPRQDKLAPEELDAGTLASRLAAEGGTLSKALAACVSGTAAVCAREICAQAGADPAAPVAELDLAALSPLLVQALTSLPPSPVTLYDEAGLAADFFPFPYRTFSPQHQKPMPSLSAAMDAFYLGRDLRARMQQKSAGLQRHIKSALERTEKKKAIMLEAIRQSAQAEENRVFGDLLTANLHLIARGASSVTVQNYYADGCPETEIPLSTRLTPSQNAQSYYKKYRKAKVAGQYARGQLDAIERDLALLENALDDLDKCETTADLGEVRYVLSQAGFLRPEPSRGRGGKPKKLPEGKPCRFTAPDGTVIEVGNQMRSYRYTVQELRPLYALQPAYTAFPQPSDRPFGKPVPQRMLFRRHSFVRRARHQVAFRGFRFSSDRFYGYRLYIYSRTYIRRQTPETERKTVLRARPAQRAGTERDKPRIYHLGVQQLHGQGKVLQP